MGRVVPLAQRLQNMRRSYRIGAGAEFGIMQGVYAKLEYVYSDFGSSAYRLDEDTTLEVNSDRHQVLVGVGMRF